MSSSPTGINRDDNVAAHVPHEVVEGCLDCPHPDYCAGMGQCEPPARSFWRWRQAWWPPALRRALYSWQQTCDEQEMELAALRGVVLQAQQAVDSFDRKPTDGNVRDVIGLAESLRRYRAMRDGRPTPSSAPRASRSRGAA